MSGSARMNEEQIAEAISNTFKEGITSIEVAPRRIFISAGKDILLEMCNKMKNDLAFEHVSCVTGVDMRTHFQVVYHIYSYQNKVTVEILVDNIDRERPEVDSITPLWGGANWHEREAYDMFGIIFKNHPKMERLLMPDDFQFFPLRKDFTPGGRAN